MGVDAAIGAFQAKLLFSPTTDPFVSLNRNCHYYFQPCPFLVFG
jgi:hypothetical protein